MITTFYVVCVALLLLVTADAFSWTITIIRHAQWLSKRPDYAEGLAINPRTLRTISVISTFFLVGTWLLFTDHITHVALGKDDSFRHTVELYLICMSVALTHIHLWALVARSTCLHMNFWPFLSARIANSLQPITGNDYLGEYCVQFKEWRELTDISKRHRTVLVNFLDIVPDLVWTKDENDRFTYVNKSMSEKLLCVNELDAIGRTDAEIMAISKVDKAKFTFGEVCATSDEIVKKTGKPQLFMEYGLVNNQFVALQVLKAPIFSNEYGAPEIVGTIGIGRDVTHIFNEHETIMQKLEDGDFEEACEMFKNHAERFKAYYKQSYCSMCVEKGDRDAKVIPTR